MRRESFICGACRTHVEQRLDRFEARVEIRRADRGSSLWSRTLMRLCRACAMKGAVQERAEVEAQGTLL